jgi:predicted extracellular nuclease
MQHRISLAACLLLVSVLSFTSCQSGLKKLHMPSKGLTFAFYNVENIFDTIDDPAINDAEFLPASKSEWNTKKFNHKIENIARVIASMDTTDYPDMLGLAEIENREVLQVLVNHPYITDAKYSMIHYPDHDDRGIEVAFLYRPEFFRPVTSVTLDYHVDSIANANPRHILYVKGVVASKDTLHIFINHWMSRFGGQKETIWGRNSAGIFLRKVADSLMTIDPNANIIIAGDLNDNPDDASLTQYLKALPHNNEVLPGNLYNLAYKPFKEGKGTLYYKSWDFFDQIIVSPSLLNSVSGRLKSGDIEIVDRDWMLYTSKSGEKRPNRTYSGGKYFGGYSDHLPVMIRLKVSQK